MSKREAAASSDIRRKRVGTGIARLGASEPLPSVALALAGLVGLAVAGVPSSAAAVDGISVTIHWSGTNENLYGGYGSVWRHDIKNTDAVSHNKLYDGPARMAKISPDGKRVALIKKNGMVAFMSIDGGAVTDLVQSHGEASLDWPQGDWIYYTLGGFSQPSGSKVLRRVNVVSKKDEAVVTWSSGTWFFSISADLKRAAVRPDDSPPEPYGNIVAYDMINDGGTLRTDRGVDRWSCGTGMDPQGVHFMDGWSGAHTGMDIRRWDNLNKVMSWAHADAKNWAGPDKGIDSGTGHNRNNWSVNSQKWISVHLGWGTRGSNGANQVLYNWVDQQRIVVTNNTDGSKQFDSSGGFWVGSVVTPPTPPSISKQPSNVTVTEGQNATFSVTAAGSTPLSYQWQRNGSNVSGATSGSHTLSSAQLSDSGATFRCKVSNAAGSVTSNNATLTVTGAVTKPTITKHPLSGTVTEGDKATFSVAASGSAPLSYQWQRNGSNISGATSASYTLSSTKLSENGATFRCKVTNAAGSATSNNATLTVKAADIAPSIAKQPNSTTVTEGQKATFSVTASGSAPLSFQWQRNGSNISGATAASYTLSAAKLSDDGATFGCKVTNAAGGATSNNATLTVLPENTTQNTAPVVDAGDDAEIDVGKSVLLFGTVKDDGLPDATLDLTWERVSGPDAVTMATPHTERTTATFDQVGTYLLRLTASDGELEGTDDLTITVTEPPSITLLSPVGEEVWPAGSVQTIRWNTVGVDDVAIELSLDDGSNWETISPSVDTVSDQWGAYAWTVPNTPSTTCRIAITAYIGGANGNRSPGPFTITTGAGGDAGPADGGSPVVASGARGAAPQYQLVGGCSATPNSPSCVVLVLVAAIVAIGRRRRIG